MQISVPSCDQLLLSLKWYHQIQNTGLPYLKCQEHEVNPYARVPCLHCEKRTVIQAVFSTSLTCKMEFG